MLSNRSFEKRYARISLPRTSRLPELCAAACTQIDYDKLEEEWMDDEEDDGGAQQ